MKGTGKDQPDTGERSSGLHAAGVHGDDVYVCPASATQAALWFLDRVQPDLPTYNIATAFLVQGPIDRPALQAAVDALVARHEALRTTFAVEGDRPVQVIHETACVLVDVVRLEDGAEPEADARQQAALEARQPFDLATGPLLRVRVFTFAPDRALLTIVVHHIVSDGWSQAILLAELGQLYRAAKRGEAASLPPLGLQYADFCLWQEKRLTPALTERQNAYWRTALDGAAEAMALPSDQPLAGAPSGRGGCVFATLPPATTQAIRQVCRTEGVTLFMFLVAALDVLIARHTGARDIAIGAPTAGRPRPELESSIGFFANTVVVRTTIDAPSTFRQILQRVKTAALGAYEHQDVPFSDVVQAVRPGRTPGRTPLFQVMCAVLRAPDEGLVLDGASVTPEPIHNGGAKFDWLWEFDEHATTVRVAFEFRRDQLSEPAATAILRRFGALVDAIVATPDGVFTTLPMLPDEERRLIHAWNASPVARPAGATVLDAFHRQVDATPAAVALDDHGAVVSYRDLSARAWRLAHYLRREGVRRGDRVGLSIDRGNDLVTALLAILEAGAAYVPLDPAYPRDRRRLMAEDADVRLVLTSSAAGGADGIAGSAPVLPIDEHRAPIAAMPGVPLDAAPVVSDACYVMYTSGSTGRPKGVVMPHGPLANLVEWQVRRTGRPLTTLQYGSPSFDVSFQEIFATLTAGGRLVLVSEAERREPGSLIDILDQNEVERLFLPFVALQAIAETAAARGRAPSHLREVVTAGEQLRITTAIRWLFSAMPDCRLDNQYGPTETHVATAHQLTGDPADWPELPPIGRPIANARVHLLDETGQLVPPGVEADLWIGGHCLADGYWQQPERTAERFQTLDIDGQTERVYRSGDRARYRSDGSIEFLGRGDDQVKIRGYRVEPGEIEAALEAHPGVRHAAVVARPIGNALALAGFVVPAAPGGVVESELRESLRSRLPDYLVPGTISFLDSMPMTPSGKVDRRRLLTMETATGMSSPDDVGPRDAVERDLAAIWADVLGTQAIRPHDDFFALGGHSLLAVRIAARVRSAFGVDLTLAELFEHSTVAALARVVRSRQGTGVPRERIARTPRRAVPGGPGPSSPDA